MDGAKKSERLTFGKQSHCALSIVGQLIALSVTDVVIRN